MTLTDFRKEMLEEVRVAAELKQHFLRACFVEDAGARLTAAEEVVDFAPCKFEGTGTNGRKLQIDGYSFDDTDGSFSLVVGEFSNEDEMPSFGATETRRLFGMLRAYVEDAMNGKLTDGSVEESQPGYGLATDLMSMRENVVRFRFYLINDAQLNTRVKDWPVEDVCGIPTEFHIWDIARFHGSHESATGRDDLTVDFKEFGCDGLPSLKAGASDGDYQAYLCMIPGEVLANVYDSFGSRLLEGNVRSFLSAKGKVNAKIQATVKTSPEMFFAYNNGIAATAEQIVCTESGEGLLITAATNLQIVNGGQTTASLAHARRKDGANLSRICVQMKLSVLPPARAGALIPEIARFANSQNKVSDADFFANHPYHVRLEELSRRIFTPAAPGRQHGTHWFYERARGQFANEQANLTVAVKKQFLLQNPKSQLLTKTDIAKLESTWRGLPHKVSLGAQKNFTLFAESVAKLWTEDDAQFNEQYYRNLVALAILFRHTEAVVSHQSWYQGGYRANIVTYTLAKLRDAISEQRLGFQLNLRAIWEKQAVAQEITDQLAAIAKRVFSILTDLTRSKENVTEWAKMQACWERVRTDKLVLSRQIDVHLSDIKAVTAREKEAKSERQMDRGIEVQIAVIAIPGSKWETLRQWANNKGLLTSSEAELLRVAGKIPMKVPTDRQCTQLWQLRAKLIESGFAE